MKKYISVLAIEVRSTIYKIFLLLVVMAAAQLTDFYMVLKESEEDFALTMRAIPYSFEDVFQEAHTNAVLFFSLCAAAFILIWAVSEKGKVKSRHFLWRLSLERKQIVLLQAGYHVLCFVMIFAVQICIAVVMYEMYRRVYGITGTSQDLLMAFYRNNFLHNILPLSDWFRGIRLVTTILLAGMGTVYIGYAGFTMKGGSIPWAITYLSVWMWVLILSGMELLIVDIFCVLFGIGVLAVIMLIFLDKMGEFYYEG